jgi:uncharacterized repeat protein (TIGR01451 family)
MRRLSVAAVGRLVLLTLLVPATAGATSEPPAGPSLAVTVGVEQEIARTTKEGRTIVERVPVGIARPGDTLVYTLRAENTGGAPAFDARLEDPIPQGTVLVPDSVPTTGLTALASLDGGRNWQPFPARIPAPEGVDATMPAPPESYTHLRWVVGQPIVPGEAREVTFKVRIR